SPAAALRGGAGANRQQRAGHVYGQIQDGAGDQVLVVEITPVPARRAARDPPPERGGGPPNPTQTRRGEGRAPPRGRRWRPPNRTEERRQRERNPGLELDARRPWAPAQQPKPGIRV